jgi:serine/threonine protein kinase
MGVELAITSRPGVHYEFVDCLGAGGMAETWEVKQVRDDGYCHRFCLKFIRPEFRNAPLYQRLFRREAQIGTELHHKNIVSLIEVDAELGFLRFELIDGVNLRELLASLPDSRLSSELARFIAVEVCQALEYVHGAGVLHQDVKAANVLISTHGEVKLVDFGIAIQMPTDGPATKVRGTPEYMAPEQAEQHHVDGRTDLFSLGVIIYEMLTGRLPADSASDYQIYEQLARRDYPPLTELIDVDEGLAAIGDTLLQPAPGARWQNAAACLDQLCEVPPKPTLSRELGRLVRTAQVGVTRKRKKTPITSFVKPMIAARARKASQTTTQPTGAIAVRIAEEPRLRVERAQPFTTVSKGAQSTKERAALDVAVARVEDESRVRADTTTIEIMRRTVLAPRRRTLGVLGVTALLALLVATSTALTRDSRPSSRVVPKRSDVPTVVAPTIAAPQTPKLEFAQAPPSEQPDTNSTVASADVLQPQMTGEAAQSSPPSKNGVLRLGSFPANHIWVNGKSHPAPFIAQVPPGKYWIGVGDEHPTQTRWVQVRSGKVTEAYFDLSGGAEETRN